MATEEKWVGRSRVVLSVLVLGIAEIARAWGYNPPETRELHEWLDMGNIVLGYLVSGGSGAIAIGLLIWHKIRPDSPAGPAVLTWKPKPPAWGRFAVVEPPKPKRRPGPKR